MKKTIDMSNASVLLEWTDGRRMNVKVDTLRSDMFLRLALEGAAAVLQHKRDPEQSWKDILAGRYKNKPIRVPLTVHALSNILKISKDEALKQWNDLSPDEKRQYQNDPHIQLEMAKIKASRAGVQT